FRRRRVVGPGERWPVIDLAPILGFAVLGDGNLEDAAALRAGRFFAALVGREFHLLKAEWAFHGDRAADRLRLGGAVRARGARHQFAGLELAAQRGPGERFDGVGTARFRRLWDRHQRFAARAVGLQARALVRHAERLRTTRAPEKDR